jgi:hypothetical protein
MEDVQGRQPTLREVLRQTPRDAPLWPGDQQKPSDPKRAVEWALRVVGKPRSSSIYRALASKISFARCQDRSFVRLKGLLQGWFGPETRQR